MSGNVYVNTKNQAIHATNKSALITVAGMVPNVPEHQIKQKECSGCKKNQESFCSGFEIFLKFLQIGADQISIFSAGFFHGYTI